MNFNSFLSFFNISFRFNDKRQDLGDQLPGPWERTYKSTLKRALSSINDSARHVSSRANLGNQKSSE